MRKIGEVILDDTLYPGSDLYTDGAIEDEMLRIAKSCSPQRFNEVIAEKKSWPILYHFSHIRENIVSWLPFTGKEEVLEIGSGCGAVTGALLAGAAEVTCIDLSMKRSEINAWRHRDSRNLKILVGNFQDIEKTLTRQYDYITLIGVFEYGEAYIKSETPYPDFLRIVQKHLKPDGKIVIAIENRFGLKYWAGCTEDHHGTLFEGLEGYPSTKGVKTFTLKELKQIFREAGELQSTWYYPFPDYKFPMTLYSDRRLPQKGELNRTEYNFDRLRLRLFEESAVYDSLLDNDLYPQFANSFLVLLGKEKTLPEAAYVKFSNERAPEFNIRTEICMDGEARRCVRKLPVDKVAAGHVQRLLSISQGLEECFAAEGLQVNRCRPSADGVELEFLEGCTLEELLDAQLEAGQPEAAEELLLSYLKKIEHIYGQENFEASPAFEEVFGRENLPANLRGGRLADIDLVPANILLTGAREEAPCVIDYEWTFDFLVPAHFIMYRMLHYYLESDGKRHPMKNRGLYEKVGISEEEQAVYARMEAHFQKYMTGKHVPVLSLYDAISPGKLDAVEYYERIRGCGDERRLQVFFDRGQDFREADSFKYPMTRRGIRMDIPVPAGTRRMRLDPGEVPGGFRIVKLRWRDLGRASFRTNGFQLDGNSYYFGGGDPQIILENVPHAAEVLTLELENLREQEAVAEFWRQFAAVDGEKNARIRLLEDQLKQREQVIREMENTKAWKLYRKLKKQ